MAFFEAGDDRAWMNTVVAAGTISNEGDLRHYRLLQLAVEADRGDAPDLGCRLEPLFTLDNTVDVGSIVAHTRRGLGVRAIGRVHAADLQGTRFPGPSPWPHRR